MRIFAIADPHLSKCDPKPMDIFGGNWQGHPEIFFERWQEIVAEDDLVQAYAYANLATVRQHTEARALRDGLEAQMTSDQINAGQEQAKAWTASRIAEQAAEQQAQQPANTGEQAGVGGSEAEATAEPNTGETAAATDAPVEQEQEQEEVQP